jgi:hypothetical protein
MGVIQILRTRTQKMHLSASYIFRPDEILPYKPKKRWFVAQEKFNLTVQDRYVLHNCSYSQFPSKIMDDPVRLLISLLLSHKYIVYPTIIDYMGITNRRFSLHPHISDREYLAQNIMFLRFLDRTLCKSVTVYVMSVLGGLLEAEYWFDNFTNEKFPVMGESFNPGKFDLDKEISTMKNNYFPSHRPYVDREIDAIHRRCRIEMRMEGRRKNMKSFLQTFLPYWSEEQIDFLVKDYQTEKHTKLKISPLLSLSVVRQLPLSYDKKHELAYIKPSTIVNGQCVGCWMQNRGEDVVHMCHYQSQPSEVLSPEHATAPPVIGYDKDGNVIV